MMISYFSLCSKLYPLGTPYVISNALIKVPSFGAILEVVLQVQYLI